MNENTVVSHVRLVWEVTVNPSSKGFGPQMSRKVSQSMDIKFIDAKPINSEKIPDQPEHKGNDADDYIQWNNKYNGTIQYALTPL